MDERTFYELLGVSKDATQAEIKSSFRQLALKHHPDQGGDSGTFHDLEQAYETLVSPSRRAEYDAKLASSGIGDWFAYADEPTTQHRFDQSHVPGYADEHSPTVQWQGPDWDNAGWGSQSQSWADREPPEPQRPTYVASDDPGFRLGSISPTARKVALLLIAAWVVFALFIGAPVIPGFDNGFVLRLAIFALFTWIIGSIVLRVGGVILVLWTLWQTASYDMSTASSLILISLGFLMWLGGHWLFTFKHGQWRSFLAMRMLENLPGMANPIWRWHAKTIHLD